MAVFFDQKVQTAAAGPYDLVEWHKTLPILAVGAYDNNNGGSVHLYNEEVGAHKHISHMI